MLDELFETVGCCYFSDMKFADDSTRKKIAHIIETRYPAEAISLWEWNDALNYLVKALRNQLHRRRVISCCSSSGFQTEGYHKCLCDCQTVWVEAKPHGGGFAESSGNGERNV